MKLESTTLPVAEVTTVMATEMFRLMQTHYEGVTESQFQADLREKKWVILLYDGGQLRGFSTQVVFDYEHRGQRLNILYSGDTIIDKRYWGSMALPVAWGRLMLSLVADYPDRELYWLLTSKGYKTYRFLPVFFHEFYPCYEKATPTLEDELLKSLALQKYESFFDSEKGIVRAGMNAQRLREGLAEIDEKRLRDPHVAYFQQRNPGHINGDELVCLARCHVGNLTDYIRRQL